MLSPRSVGREKLNYKSLWNKKQSGNIRLHYFNTALFYCILRIKLDWKDWTDSRFYSTFVLNSPVDFTTTYNAIYINIECHAPGNHKTIVFYKSSGSINWGNWVEKWVCRSGRSVCILDYKILLWVKNKRPFDKTYTHSEQIFDFTWNFSISIIHGKLILNLFYLYLFSEHKIPRMKFELFFRGKQTQTKHYLNLHPKVNKISMKLT